MEPPQALVAGVGLGAGLMYVLDPRAGRQRRALLRDQAAHLTHRARAAASVTSRDIAHRTHGAVAELRARRGHAPVPDNVLVARVRAELGLVVRHPHRVTVMADHGRVTLSGEVDEDELYHLWPRLAAIPGVVDAESRLESSADGAAGEALEPAPRGGKPDLLQERWSPTTRLLVGSIGGGLAIGGLLQGKRLGIMVGLGLFARAVTNLELQRLVGIGAGRRAVDVQKTINVAAPVERVFELWAHYERFPQIMDCVRDVERLAGDRSRWVLVGPFGCSATWRAIVTQLVPNEVLAWKTESGSMVRHEGRARFQTNPDGTTRVDIRMSYNPPGGALGHAVARLLGCDPKHLMDRDLVRFQSFVEHGKTTAHHKTITRDDLPIEPLAADRETSGTAP